VLFPYTSLFRSNRSIPKITCFAVRFGGAMKPFVKNFLPDVRMPDAEVASVISITYRPDGFCPDKYKPITMKASVRSKYGKAEVIRIQETEKPTPKDDELLIKVHAATVNRSDYHALTGKPVFMRLMTGLLKPKLPITGSDFAGEVEAAGRSAKLFKAGDRVMGFIDLGSQSHAQYLAI